MKKTQFLLLLVTIMTSVLNAQTFRIDTADVSFENKQRPCLVVKYDADAKTVKKGWADYMKKNYKVKVKGIGLLTDKDIVDAEDITITSVSDKRMNMYAKVIDVGGLSEMKYFASFGYDFFIGPKEYAKEFEAMNKLLNDFSISFLNDYYANQTSDLLKKIKGYEKDIKGNEKDIENNIKKAKKSSDAVASALEAKNNSLKLENEQLNAKIILLRKDIEGIKVKQDGIIIK